MLESKRENVQDLCLGKEFFNSTIKAQFIKGKFDKFVPMKNLNFCYTEKL